MDDAAENAAIIDTRKHPEASGTDVECVSSVLREASKDATWIVLLSLLNHEATMNGIDHTIVCSAWSTGHPTKTVR